MKEGIWSLHWECVAPGHYRAITRYGPCEIIRVTAPNGAASWRALSAAIWANPLVGSDYLHATLNQAKRHCFVAWCRRRTIEPVSLLEHLAHWIFKLPLLNTEASQASCSLLEMGLTQTKTFLRQGGFLGAYNLLMSYARLVSCCRPGEASFLGVPPLAVPPLVERLAIEALGDPALLGVLHDCCLDAGLADLAKDAAYCQRLVHAVSGSQPARAT